MAQPILPVSAQAEINGLYVALYDVPATQAGINYWLGVLQGQDPSITSASSPVSTADAQYLGQQMTANAPVVNGTTYFATLYPTTMTDVSFVEALYMNTAGFQGTEPGIQFWTTQLAVLEASGDTVIQAREAIAGNFVEAFLQNNLSLGASYWGLDQSDYTALVTGQQALLNKVSVSEYWAINSTSDNGLLNYTAANLNPPSGPFSAGQGLINTITSNSASVTTADNAINSAVNSVPPSLTPITNVQPSSQQTVSLTAGTDNITAANNYNNVAITGVVDNAVSNNQTTAQVFDTINPGGTNNSTTITTVNTVPTLSSSNLPPLSNVQSFFITNADSPATNVTATLTGVGPALTTIGVNGGGTGQVTFSGFSGTQITNFTVMNQTQGAAVTDQFIPNSGLTSDGAASGAATVNVSNDPATGSGKLVSGTIDAGTVNVDIHDASGMDGYSNLTLNSIGPVANELTSFGTTGAAATLTTLTITGSAAVKVDDEIIFGNGANIQASTDTGGFKIGIGPTVGSAVTLLGGSGVEALVIGDSNLTAPGTSLNGGTGTAGNILTVNNWANSAADYTALNGATTGFQVLGLLNGVGTVNAANITNPDISSFEIRTAGYTIDNLGDGATVRVLVAGPESATAEVGATMLHLVIGESFLQGISITKMTTTGFSTINLSSNGSTSNTVVFANSDNTDFVVTGADGLTATISGIGSGDTWNSSAFTGALTLTGSAFGGDVISTGSGTTTITEEAATSLPDTITYLSGHTATDTLISQGSNNTAGQGFDKVANYALGQDVLSNGTAGALHQATSSDMIGVATGTGLVVASTFTSSTAFITAAEATTTAAKGDVAAWSDGTNTWVAEWYAATTANSAHIVELVGVTGATSINTTAGAGTITIA